MGQSYEAAVTKTSGAAPGPLACLVSTAATRLSLRELSVYLTTGVAAEIGTGRPAVVGVTPSGAVTGQTGDPADAVAVGTLVPLFTGTVPTAPTNPMRRLWLPAQIGAGVTWTWGVGELLVPVSAQLVIWQFSSVAVSYEITAKWIE